MDTSLRFTTSPDFAAFFDVLPAAVRDPDLRTRIAELYDWYRQLNRESLHPERGAAPDHKVATLATIFLSSMDGLIVQEMLDPEAVDLEAVGAMWKTLIASILGQ